MLFTAVNGIFHKYTIIDIAIRYIVDVSDDEQRSEVQYKNKHVKFSVLTYLSTLYTYWELGD